MWGCSRNTCRHALRQLERVDRARQECSGPLKGWRVLYQEADLVYPHGRRMQYSREGRDECWFNNVSCTLLNGWVVPYGEAGSLQKEEKRIFFDDIN